MSRAPEEKGKPEPVKTEETRAPKAPPEEKKPTGRPSKYTPEIFADICDQLSKGTPLTIICKPDHMPCPGTIRNWMEADEALSDAIARAREAGFDAIAMEALDIADNVGHEHQDTIETKFGEIPNKEWILRSKLRVETRLKLLAKWDPKRYGDKISQEISGPGGKPVETRQTVEITPEVEKRIAEAAKLAANLEAPACMKEREADEQTSGEGG